MNTIAAGLNAGAATLAAAVLADSTIEHYRGGFYRPAMFVGPLVSAVTCGVAIAGTRHPGHQAASRSMLFALAAFTGALGCWFHLRNVSRRGGLQWANLFHGAPAAAPLGLHVAGLLGLCAQGVTEGAAAQCSLNVRATPALAGWLTVTSLIGTSAEAWLFHFRGAFQNPVMYVPVTLPPVAAGALAAALVRGQSSPAAHRLLQATAWLGIFGVAFHAYGVGRRMGGWRNAVQNVLSGPPLPAPLAFTGLALAGLAVLHLVDREVESHGVSHPLP